MTRKIFQFIFIHLFAVTIFAHCSGSSSDKTDGDISTDDLSTPDELQVEPPVDLPADETPPPDIVEDPDVDHEDLEQDTIEDTPPDAEPETEDAEEEETIGPCIPLLAVIEDPYSWTLAFMGYGTNAVFTLTLSNTNPSGGTCSFDSIELSEAVLKDAGDDSVIVTYDTIEVTSGTADPDLAPGESSSTEYVVRYPDSTTGYCDHSVYLELSIDYDVDGTAAPTHNIKSDPIGHECVY